MARTTTQARVIKAMHYANLERDLRNRYVNLGWSLRRIAEHYKVSPPTISRWLDDISIERRPRGRPRKDGTIPSYAVDLQ